MRNVSRLFPTIIFQDAELCKNKLKRILTILVDAKRIDECDDITRKYNFKNLFLQILGIFSTYSNASLWLHVHAELLFCLDVGPTSITLAVQPWFSIKCVSYSCLLGDLEYQCFTSADYKYSYQYNVCSKS